MDRLRSSGGWTDSGVMVGGQSPREYTHKENFIELHSYGDHALPVLMIVTLLQHMGRPVEPVQVLQSCIQCLATIRSVGRV